MKEDFDQYLPLPAAALHILLALASEDRHGYGIMREVARQSDGRYKLGPGTLYDNLSAMIQGAAIIACHVLAADSWLRRSRDSKAWSAKRDYISNHVPRGHDEPHLVSLAHLFASTRLSSAVRARTSLDIRRIQ
jgi:hypothetical protein